MFKHLEPVKLSWLSVDIRVRECRQRLGCFYVWLSFYFLSGPWELLCKQPLGESVLYGELISLLVLFICAGTQPRWQTGMSVELGCLRVFPLSSASHWAKDLWQSYQFPLCLPGFQDFPVKFLAGCGMCYLPKASLQTSLALSAFSVYFLRTCHFYQQCWRV